MDLKSCPLFAEFTATELAAVQKLARPTVLEAGAWAFHENEKGDSLLILAAGTLRITKQSGTGDDEELAVLATGNYVGEMAFFGKGRRSASGQAVERAEIVALPYGELRALLDAHPPIAAKFYKAVATGIARRLQGMNENVTFLKSYLKSRA